MNLNLRKFTVHKDWLFKMRYDERFINHKEPSGKFIERLRKAFERTATENFWGEKIIAIPVTIEGIFFHKDGSLGDKRRTFDAKGDTVKFNFSFSFNPESGHLDLPKMTAVLNDDEIEYLIERNTRWQLPDAEKAYKDLLKLGKKKLLQKIQEATLNRKNTTKRGPFR